MKPVLYRNNNTNDYSFISHEGRLYTFTVMNGQAKLVQFRGKVNESYAASGQLQYKVPGFLKKVCFDLNRKAG